MKINWETIHQLDANELWTPLDLHFARFIHELNHGDCPELFFAAAMVSHWKSQGHICLDLRAVEGTTVMPKLPLRYPSAKSMIQVLSDSPVVGKPEQYCPLILDKAGRIYLYRYWEYQKILAEKIRKWMTQPAGITNYQLLGQQLDQLFPADPELIVDWQKIAAFGAVTQHFFVISGGPGTGKTTTIAKMLVLLIQQALEKSPGQIPRIALAAPTGKAAARLSDSIAQTKKNGLPHVAAALIDPIPDSAATIHRLLGTIPGSPNFRHHSEFPLPVDILVVDEASMVDLALMAKLVSAMPDRSRLILAGDRDQLASVEAGAVLADICDLGDVGCFSQSFHDTWHLVTDTPLMSQGVGISSADKSDFVVQLEKNYRFGQTSAIFRVSRKIRQGDADGVAHLLQTQDLSGVFWNPLPASMNVFLNHIRESIIDGYRPYLQAQSIRQAFECLDQFRILCAVREGPFGVISLNRITEYLLHKEGLIDPGSKWYPGRPVLILRNDYQLGLFNGDVGIILEDPEADGQLRAFFPGLQGEWKKFHPSRLPEHETVFAMTVHKSQGSEFDRILLILPDQDAPLLTRELVYTGMTRARQQVDIHADMAIFKRAIQRRVYRSSGLKDALLSDDIQKKNEKVSPNDIHGTNGSD